MMGCSDNYSVLRSRIESGKTSGAVTDSKSEPGPPIRSQSVEQIPSEHEGRHEAKVPARLMIVDDEDFIRDLYKDAFELKGFTVFSARDGDEAIRVLNGMKHRPDFVIMDYRMPGKDGIETTKEILNIDPSIPVVFSSADESVREKALAAGAVSFWAKPFPVTLLVNAMIDMIEARRGRTA